MIRAVIDTNVLVAALRSSAGASHEILLAADRGEFEVALSVPLLAEYDDACHRPGSGISIPPSAIDSVINRIAERAAKGSREDFLKAMDMVPAGKVAEGDEIQSQYKRKGNRPS